MRVGQGALDATDWVALARDPIEELERLYKLGHNATPDDSPELEEARRELVKLQNGDPENVALWKTFSEVSLAAFQQIYDRLGIAFDHHLGESFYNDKVGRVYQELTDAGLAQESEGALVVFHPEHPRFKTQPFLIRKADGASNYASTDLATAAYRAEHFKADGIVIVTDFRQADHFEQLLSVYRAAAEGEDAATIDAVRDDVARMRAVLRPLVGPAAERLAEEAHERYRVRELVETPRYAAA